MFTIHKIISFWIFYNYGNVYISYSILSYDIAPWKCAKFT